MYLLWAPAQRKRATMLYFANVYLFFLWPPYSPALVNGGSRKFYNLAYFQTPPANFLLSRPNAAEYCNSGKKLVKHRWFLYNVCHVW